MYNTNFRPNSRMDKCLDTFEVTPRERELVRMLASCMPSAICPDDEAIVRTLNRDGTVSFAAADISALAPGATASLVISAIGVEHCFMLGLEMSTLASTDSYKLEFIRNGNVVGTAVRANFLATTANPRAACPCTVCVGEIQTLTLRVTNTGAAWAAGVALGFQFCRDFDNPYCAAAPAACAKGC